MATLREPDSPETEGFRQKKERRRQLTGGRDRWETRAAATMIETRCAYPYCTRRTGKGREGRRSTEERGKSSELTEDEVRKISEMGSGKEARRQENERQMDKGG